MLILSCRSDIRPGSRKETRLMMGTVVSIELAGDNTGAVMEELWREAERLESIFSRYLPGSELSRINREAFEAPAAISPEMEDVLTEAGRISGLTEGAFDITVGPLMKLWGFFPDREGRVPARAEVEAVRRRADWKLVDLDPEARTVRFSRRGVEVDLAALAKGYVVDRLAELARRGGITHALIDAGGDLYCLGKSPAGRDWEIGVEHPRRPGEILRTLSLSDRAVATSGDYRNYFIRSRKRYSHIVDPRTGYPARTGVVEVTVIAPRCVTADALATAIFVSGAPAGLELLNRLDGVEGMIVTEKEGRVEARFSDGFPGDT